jgi:hypothetical protein
MFFLNDTVAIFGRFSSGIYFFGNFTFGTCGLLVILSIGIGTFRLLVNLCIENYSGVSVFVP